MDEPDSPFDLLLLLLVILTCVLLWACLALVGDGGEIDVARARAAPEPWVKGR